MWGKNTLFVRKLGCVGYLLWLALIIAFAAGLLPQILRGFKSESNDPSSKASGISQTWEIDAIPGLSQV